MAYGNRGISQYQQVGTQAASYADPYELTAMLFQGVLDRIAQARHALNERNVQVKGERIGKAITIIDALRYSLDHAAGGELAGNLDSLYEYAQRRLLEANLHNDADRLDEVAGILRSIKEGWDGIPADQRNPARGGVAESGNGTIG